MATAFNELSRPNYFEDELFDTVGLLSRVWVDQEATGDGIGFVLQVFRTEGASNARELRFRLTLDSNTAVAVAQFQLLRDALRSRWNVRSETNIPLLVRVHFNWDSAAHNYGHVYWLSTVADYSSMSVEAYFGVSTSNWWVKGSEIDT